MYCTLFRIERPHLSMTSTCWPAVYHLRWSCDNILSFSYWTDAGWNENVTLDEKRTTVHIKGHWGRNRVVSSTHTLHTVTFPQCCAGNGAGLGLLNGEGDETEGAAAFFVLISSAGKTKKLLHLLCSLHSYLSTLSSSAHHLISSLPSLSF